MPSNSKEYAKRYYEMNKQKILAQMGENIYCNHCCSDVTKSNFPAHLRSRKHLRLENINLEKESATMTMQTIADKLLSLELLLKKVENRKSENSAKSVLERALKSLSRVSKPLSQQPIDTSESSEIDFEPDETESESD